MPGEEPLSALTAIRPESANCSCHSPESDHRTFSSKLDQLQGMRNDPEDGSRSRRVSHLHNRCDVLRGDRIRFPRCLAFGTERRGRIGVVAGNGEHLGSDWLEGSPATFQRPLQRDADRPTCSLPRPRPKRATHVSTVGRRGASRERQHSTLPAPFARRGDR